MRRGAFLLIIGACAWTGLVGFYFGRSENSFAGKPTTESVQPEPLKADQVVSQRPEQPVLKRISDRIRNGETLSGALARHAIGGSEIHHLTASLNKEVNLRSIRAGDVFVLEQQGAADSIDRLDAFELVRSNFKGAPVRFRATRMPQPQEAESVNPAFWTQRIDTPVSTKVSAVTGRVDTSLYESIIQAGGDPTLVNRFADVFGWQIDFYRDTQKNDAFKMVVETRYADGRFIGYGQVMAAEYENMGTTYRGFYYESPDGRIAGIYDEKGQSLQRAFLKNPMEFSRITSRFGQRFHPVLKQRKQHNGVDYGAARGTPFWSIADGIVTEAGYKGAAGNMVRIRHKNGYMTEYFHASRIAAGIRVGSRVRQRQVIGFVGTTGRSTGPHLHLGMKLHGRYVNPSRQQFPSGDPIPKGELAKFLEHIKPLVAQLKEANMT